MALYAFDGTSREDDLQDEIDTNIVRFARAYRGRRFYRSGVGTRFGPVGAVFGGWIGLGLHARVDEAMKALRKNFERGDKEIDIIGFSRGAAAARHFANAIWDKIGDKKKSAPPIRFLGLFDTVASTGILPGPVDVNLDLELPPNVLKCCQAMALDEGRMSFSLQRVKAVKGTKLKEGVLEELWFRGCHSDIGGGLERDALANIPLCWMLRRAVESGLRFDEVEVSRAVSARNRDAAIRRSPIDKGAKKRKMKPGDCVHWSVAVREKAGKVWHGNPTVGCGVMGDWGEPRGEFPTTSPWPEQIDWKDGLVPRPVLRVGDAPVRIEVFADTEWNEMPNVSLEAGGTYHFAVVEGPDDWVDGGETDTNGAEGYEKFVLKAFKWLATLPSAEWFALVGAIDRAEFFRIGSACEHRPTQDGELSCFANDAWFRYENNRGRLVVAVKRLS